MRIGPRWPSRKGSHRGAYVLATLCVELARSEGAARLGLDHRPRKAAYNRIYSRTTFDVLSPRRGRGGSVLGGLLAVGIVTLLLRTCGG